ncbi:hypothetical protein [Flavobacterium sp. LB2R40]|uniref:hypothetical protein n=1 Tax=Flavobacterium sp. LB2R40 TaxID=3401722 RepID=UPI003AAB60C4
MKFNKLLFAFTILLISILLFESISNLDIGRTKNDYLTNKEKMKTDKYENIEALKNFAKSKIEIIKQNRILESNKATNRIYLIIGILLLQITIQILNKKPNG